MSFGVHYIAFLVDSPLRVDFATLHQKIKFTYEPKNDLGCIEHPSVSLLVHFSSHEAHHRSSCEHFFVALADLKGLISIQIPQSRSTIIRDTLNMMDMTILMSMNDVSCL